MSQALSSDHCSAIGALYTWQCKSKAVKPRAAVCPLLSLQIYSQQQVTCGQGVAATQLGLVALLSGALTS